MWILGLDLSLTATGVARWDGTTETIKTRPDDGDRRLTVIRNHVREVAGTPLATLAVIEDVPPVRAHALSTIGMVHGVVRTVLADLGVPYVLVPPSNLKQFATGKGNATKPDMRMALYQRATLDIRDDNQVDAWWLRAMALDRYGEPVVQVPQSHRAALTKVAWPDRSGIDTKILQESL